MNQALSSGTFLSLALLLFSGTAVVAQSFYPSLTPSSYYILPGQPISLTGEHFAPGETVALRIGDQTITVRADDTGSIAVSTFTVPFGTNSLVIRATGATSQAETVRRITVGAYYPTLKPEKYQIVPGGTVRLQGKGFASGELVEFFENGVSRGSVAADPKGAALSSALPVPYRTDRLNFEARGALSNASAKSSVHVATLAKPWLKLSAYYLRPGSALTITGRGFGAKEEVALGIDGFTLGSAVADAQGAFSFSVRVPEGARGRRTVEAHGLSTGVEASQKFTLSIAAK
jgi:hypothetical protein